jgi:hypothetical protein
LAEWHVEPKLLTRRIGGERTGGATITTPGPSIHVGGNVSGQVAIGRFVYQAQAPGGIINQIVVDEPIRAKRRPVEVRPAADRTAIPRTAMLDEIREHFTNGPVQLIAGDGWGKTAVLRQAVHAQPLETIRDGVALVSVWGLPVEDVEQAVFEAFYESNLPGMNLKVSPGQLRTSFTDVEAGVAIDDLDVPRQHVQRILDALPRCVILSAASQQTMWSVGTTVDVEGLTPEESVSLFEQRLRRPLTTGERDAVASYAAAVFGFPMAIVTGAAAVRRSAMTFDQLATAAAATDPIAETTRATATALTLRESRILAALDAVDAAPLPPSAIAAASGVEEPEDELAGLRDDGILQVASPTFRLPNATSVLLDLADAGPATLAGLTAWTLDETDASAISAAAAAITTAMRNAAHSGDHAGSITLGRAADAGVSVSGKWGLWSRLLDQAEQSARASGSQFDLGWALHQQGTEALATGDTSMGRELLGAARSIREAIGDTEGLAATNHNLGMISGPPPAVDAPPETPTSPPPTGGGGLPWWAWTMIVVGFAVIGALVVGLILREPDVIIVTTEAPSPGTLTAQSPLVFEEVPVGQEARGSISVTNIGPGPVEVVAASTGDDTFFDVGSNCGRLEVAASCEIEVTFLSEAPGDFTTDVAIEHDGTNNPIVVEVVARAVQPSEAFAAADPVNVDFGPVDRASVESVREQQQDSPRFATVEIVNAGDRDLAITDVRLIGEAFFPLPPSPPCGALSPGDRCPIDVLFLAIEPGPHEGELIVDHTGDNSPIVVPLTGFVLEPPNLVIAVAEPYEGDIPFLLVEGLFEYAISVEITNASGEPVDAMFWIHVEQFQPEFDRFIPAVFFLDRELAFRLPVEQPIGTGETITVEARIGVDPDATRRDEGGPEIRVVVDSCLGQEFVPPFCMIEESNEDDNTSAPVFLPGPDVVG